MKWENWSVGPFQCQGKKLVFVCTCACAILLDTKTGNKFCFSIFFVKKKEAKVSYFHLLISFNKILHFNTCDWSQNIKKIHLNKLFEMCDTDRNQQIINSFGKSFCYRTLLISQFVFNVLLSSAQADENNSRLTQWKKIRRKINKCRVNLNLVVTLDVCICIHLENIVRNCCVSFYALKNRTRAIKVTGLFFEFFVIYFWF